MPIKSRDDVTLVLVVFDHEQLLSPAVLSHLPNLGEDFLNWLRRDRLREEAQRTVLERILRLLIRGRDDENRNVPRAEIIFQPIENIPAS